MHDAARALTPPALIARVVDALRAGHSAVVPALRVSDTIKAVDANGVVLGTPERAGLRAVQTPQGFATDLVVARLQRAAHALPGPVSPTTRRSSSMSAARFRWSTATRWRSRSPPSSICCWPKRSCAGERAAPGRSGRRRAPDRIRAAVLAGGAAFRRRRRLRRSLRRRRGGTCAVRRAVVGRGARRSRRRVRGRRSALEGRQRRGHAAPRRRPARRGTATGSETLLCR